MLRIRPNSRCRGDRAPLQHRLAVSPGHRHADNVRCAPRGIATVNHRVRKSWRESLPPVECAVAPNARTPPRVAPRPVQRPVQTRRRTRRSPCPDDDHGPVNRRATVALTVVPRRMNIAPDSLRSTDLVARHAEHCRTEWLSRRWRSCRTPAQRPCERSRRALPGALRQLLDRLDQVPISLLTHADGGNRRIIAERRVERGGVDDTGGGHVAQEALPQRPRAWPDAPTRARPCAPPAS